MKKIIVFVAVLCGVIFLNQTVFAAVSVKLAWSPNSEPDLLGYKIHKGSASRAYTEQFPVVGETTFTVNGLVRGNTYYFTATAYNNVGDSGYSNEVSYSVPSVVVP